MHEAVCVTDEDDKIIIYNSEAEKIDGYKRENVIGKKEEEVYDSPDYLFSHKVTYKVKRTGKSIIEQPSEYPLSRDRNIKILYSSYPFYYKGRLSAVYNIYRNIDQIGEFIATTLEMQKKFMKEQNSNQIRARYFLDDIIGESAEMRKTISVARKTALHDSPVLIVGETGTGKELYAQGIHNAGFSSKGPFTPVNCAAIPETLLESVLFGTKKGAFTGAEDIPGLFEQAEGGSIFLDEINSMPLVLQPKLLRVLQDKLVRRIGSSREIPINCRIISATNIDPLAKGNETNIRPDLFYRLATIIIKIPPLRKRQQDIKALAKHFIEKCNIKYDLFIKDISDEVLSLFTGYNWPGNVRELENVIEGTMCLAGKNIKVFSEDLLPTYFKSKLYSTKNQLVDSVYQGTLKNALQEFEKNMIISTLQKHNGNVTQAAKELGILRQNLHYRIGKYGIKR
jgi:arginine utilization regulatory protein